MRDRATETKGKIFMRLGEKDKKATEELELNGVK